KSFSTRFKVTNFYFCYTMHHQFPNKKPHFTVGSFLNNINNFNPLQPSLKKEEVPLFFKEGLGVILKKIKPHSLPKNPVQSAAIPHPLHTHALLLQYPD